MAQRVGRQPLVLRGLVLLGLWIFAVFGAIVSGTIWLTVAAFAVHGVVFSVSYAALSTFIAERFRPEVRFSASSIIFQVGVLLGGAIAPLVATALVERTGSVWSVCAYVLAFAAVGVVATRVLGSDPVPDPVPERVADEPEGRR